MNNFGYSRATDVADAVRQIAADPAAKFIAGGTNLVDLMKYDVDAPGPADRHLASAAQDGRGDKGGRRAHRLAGAEQRSRLPSADRDALSAALQLDPRWRFAATAQYGLDRRQSPAADALLLFLRRRDALQQARARQRAARRSKASTGSMVFSAPARPASRPIRPTCASRWRRWRRGCSWYGPPASVPSPSRISTGCPATAAASTRSEPGEIVTEIDLPTTMICRNHTLSEDTRPIVLCVCALVSVAVAARKSTTARIAEARVAIGGVAHKPWRKP